MVRKARMKVADYELEVKQFLDAIRNFSEVLDGAVGVVKFGKFSPEGARFTARKLDFLKQKLALLHTSLAEVGHPPPT